MLHNAGGLFGRRLSFCAEAISMRSFSILLPLALTWACTPNFSDLDPVVDGTGEGEGEGEEESGEEGA